MRLKLFGGFAASSHPGSADRQTNEGPRIRSLPAGDLKGKDTGRAGRKPGHRRPIRWHIQHQRVICSVLQYSSIYHGCSILFSANGSTAPTVSILDSFIRGMQKNFRGRARLSYSKNQDTIRGHWKSKRNLNLDVAFTRGNVL